MSRGGPEGPFPVSACGLPGAPSPVWPVIPDRAALGLKGGPEQWGHSTMKEGKRGLGKLTSEGGIACKIRMFPRPPTLPVRRSVLSDLCLPDTKDIKRWWPHSLAIAELEVAVENFCISSVGT